jgi:hypothetical protein
MSAARALSARDSQLKTAVLERGPVCPARIGGGEMITVQAGFGGSAVIGEDEARMLARSGRGA